MAARLPEQAMRASARTGDRTTTVPVSHRISDTGRGVAEVGLLAETTVPDPANTHASAKAAALHLLNSRGTPF
jgi:hypothetical protein